MGRQTQPFPCDLFCADTTYIYLDSEGLGSIDQNQSFDVQIFSLAVLLGTLFVLNTQVMSSPFSVLTVTPLPHPNRVMDVSQGTINESALEQLELVVQCTKQIRVKDSSSKSSSAAASASSKQPEAASSSADAELAEHFPHFLWVLRDFSLQLQVLQRLFTIMFR
jgi:hypothetical protein